MKRHLTHYLLILALAVAPMQSVFAGIAALEHVSKCEMGSMTDSEHAGMDHSTQNDSDAGKTDTQCECCGDCLTMCVSMNYVSYPADDNELTVLPADSGTTSRYRLSASNQYPLADIRPPIVLR